MSTCFLIGSHTAAAALAPLLDTAIERHIVEYGVTEFVVGHYGSFDQLAAEALRREQQGKMKVQILENPQRRGRAPGRPERSGHRSGL